MQYIAISRIISRYSPQFRALVHYVAHLCPMSPTCALCRPLVPYIARLGTLPRHRALHHAPTHYFVLVRTILHHRTLDPVPAHYFTLSYTISRRRALNRVRKRHDVFDCCTIFLVIQEFVGVQFHWTRKPFSLHSQFTYPAVMHSLFVLMPTISCHGALCGVQRS